MMTLQHKQNLAHAAWQTVLQLMRSDPEIAEILANDICRDLATHAVPDDVRIMIEGTFV